MRVPIDPTQWGMIAIQKLVSALPSIEPYIQFAKIIHQDENGNGLGLIPLQDGSAFVPFVISEFSLKPIDTLISMAEGEEKFLNLSESNVMAAIGGVGLGAPIQKLPPGVSQDQGLNMFPPYGMGGALNMGRRGRPDVAGGVTKSSSEITHPENLERFLKMAQDQDRELAAILARVYRVDPIKVAEQNSMLLEPRGDEVAVYVNGEKQASLTLREANVFLGELGASDRLPTLMSGEWTVLGGTKQASAFSPVSGGKRPVKTPGEMNRPSDPFIKHDGWYRVGDERVRVFRTVYLDGRPCGVLLGVARTGYMFQRDMVGTPIAPPDTEMLKGFLAQAKLTPGMMAFAVNDITGEATIPFQVLAGSSDDKRVVLTVAPILGAHPSVRLSFGANKTPMAIDIDEIAFPGKGWTIYQLKPQRLDCNMLHVQAKRPVLVRILKGGGVFSVKEGLHTPYHGLNRGQLAHMLMNRYGLDPDSAIHMVRQAEQYLESEFYATPNEEKESMSPAFHPEAADLSIRLMRVVKLAASGPNREVQDPGESGMGAPGNMMPGPTPNTGAALMPQIANLTEVADMLASYAMGAFSPDELGGMFAKLIDDLAEVQNLVGKLLVLVRLGAVQFITEQETKRLFEETDRFRSSLLNANMLLKGIGMSV